MQICYIYILFHFSVLYSPKIHSCVLFTCNIMFSITATLEYVLLATLLFSRMTTWCDSLIIRLNWIGLQRVLFETGRYIFSEMGSLAFGQKNGWISEPWRCLFAWSHIKWQLNINEVVDIVLTQINIQLSKNEMKGTDLCSSSEAVSFSDFFWWDSSSSSTEHEGLTSYTQAWQREEKKTLQREK